MVSFWPFRGRLLGKEGRKGFSKELDEVGAIRSFEDFGILDGGATVSVPAAYLCTCGTSSTPLLGGVVLDGLDGLDGLGVGYSGLQWSSGVVAFTSAGGTMDGWQYLMLQGTRTVYNTLKRRDAEG